jgi:hypothetical protein
LGRARQSAFDTLRQAAPALVESSRPAIDSRSVRSESTRATTEAIDFEDTFELLGRWPRAVRVRSRVISSDPHQTAFQWRMTTSTTPTSR